jgi:hypothetical protein
VTELTREQKLKSLRSRLRQMRLGADGLKNEFWWRSHGCILANRAEHGQVVALTDTHTIQNGWHGSWKNDGDPAQEGATTRHVLRTCPKNIADILDRLEDLYPELADYSDLTDMKKSV